MSLPPFDGTGWIAGMPGLPGGAPPAPTTATAVWVTPPYASVSLGGISATGGIEPSNAPGHFHYDSPDGTSLVPIDGDSMFVVTVLFAGTPVLGDPVTLRATWVPDDPAAWTAPVLTADLTVNAASEDELSGWTVAELKTFAEEHDPPIPVPSSATKAQIIALILAALAADEEEN